LIGSELRSIGVTSTAHLSTVPPIAGKGAALGDEGQSTVGRVPAQPSNDLMEFALFALDHAADSVIPSGGPLVPFAFIGSGEERNLIRFPGDLTDGIERARQAIRSADGVKLAAVAWDGYLTVEGSRTDAVFVEAFKAGELESLILAQRYAGSDRIGNAAMVGRGNPLF
jgi:hypothetical protein